jgi:hypothetical protein
MAFAAVTSPSHRNYTFQRSRICPHGNAWFHPIWSRTLAVPTWLLVTAGHKVHLCPLGVAARSCNVNKANIAFILCLISMSKWGAVWYKPCSIWMCETAVYVRYEPSQEPIYSQVINASTVWLQIVLAFRGDFKLTCERLCNIDILLAYVWLG